MRLEEGLAATTRLFLDTSPIIYFVEANPRYDKLVTDIFRRITRAELMGVTSVITLSEVLVQPFLRGDDRLQREYRDLLLHSENFETLPIDANAAERAADLRARYRLRTPDALQIAIAIGANCQTFLTNDETLRRVTDLRILVLDDLEPEKLPPSSPEETH